MPFRTFRSGWGREQRGRQDADKGEVRRVFPSKLMDMSLRAGRLCSSPDSAVQSLQFHLAAAQPPAHFHPFSVLNRGTAVMSAANNTQLSEEGGLRAI